MNRTEFRFHREVGFPKGLVLPSGSFNLTYSTHAAGKAGRIAHLVDAPPKVTISGADVVDVVVNEKGQVSRFMVRQPCSARFDRCLVLAPTREGHALCVTLWAIPTGLEPEYKPDLYQKPKSFEFLFPG